MSARVSVVVPIYNVAAYLHACLDSVARQTMADLEVVMVDDGSTDESPDIAEDYAARDARFRLVRQANAGLSAARNTGVVHASAEFLAFLDSDDVLPRHTYEVLLGALDETGSDFASGNVRRLTPFGTIPAAFLGRAFERTRLQTHITRFPPLLADRTAWNKLFRKSFWDEHGFRFPEGALFEDTPVMLPAHYLARSVDVVAETVYLWRLREGADLSITQRRTDAKALHDRVAAVDHVSRFLADQGLKVSKALYDRSVVGADLRFFLDVLPSADEDYRRLFLDVVNDFLDRADPWVLEQGPAINRLKWQLVRRRALPELLEALRFEDDDLVETPPIREGRHWYGDYPYRTDERLRIPRRTYRLDEELALVSRVNDVRWEGDKLRIEGYAYIDMIGAPEPDSQQVEVVARRTGLGVRRLTLQTEAVHRPDVTRTAAQQLVSLDWSGFVATLDAAQLKRRGRWRDGTWELGVVVRAGGTVRRGWWFYPAPLHPLPLAELSADERTYVRAGTGPGDQLIVQVRRHRPLVRSHVVEAGVLQLEGDVGSVIGKHPVLHVSRSGGTASLRYPVHVDRSGDRPTFLARVPLEELVRVVESEAEQHADYAAWELYLAAEGRLTRLTLDENAPETTSSFKGREIAVQRNRFGDCTISDRSFRPVLSAVTWAPAGATISGSFRGPPGDYDLVLGAYRRPERHTVPLQHDAEASRFSAELTAEGVGLLGEGLWELLVSRRGIARESAVSMAVDHRRLAELPTSAELGRRHVELGVVGYELPALAVERRLDAAERGGFAQRGLRTAFYRSHRSDELRDVVLYDCFGGREYSDSPRAIHEELVRRKAPYRHLWVVRNGASEVPRTAETVQELTREYYEAFATARYIVANDGWPRWFARRPDQTCVQTWHGAPLKRQGCDLAEWPHAFRAYRRALRQRAENWQYVVSPGPFATPILERAYPVGGQVVETGLPRTDLLLRPNGDRSSEELRSRLGLEGKRVVLYAPTYRDHLDYRLGYRLLELRDLPTYRAALAYRDRYRLGQLLDVAALQTALGDDYVVLFRKHPRIIDVLPAEAAASVRDVSELPDAIALLRVTDVLVTDYSSLTFDFASTGRPIIFYTPDLEDYRDEIRGFSIDFESVAPGPLLRTADDAIEAVRDADTLRAAHQERYDRFVESYCSLQDGRASARLVERVFG
jgi:CDP-glycerol glycerophosphotransferase